MTNEPKPSSPPPSSARDWGSPSFWISKTIHRLSRLKRRTLVFLSVLGPGIITMIADNDAGGISTYSITGAKYGFSLLWILIVLLPVAYYIQEMTVRLGAVTKRGHAEAIFEGFGKFWGWFSIFDLAVVNWLTLVTEYIGMTAAMSIFGVPQDDERLMLELTQGLFGAAGTIGTIVASLGAGLLAQQDMRYPFYAAGIGTGTALLLGLAIGRRRLWAAMQPSHLDPAPAAAPVLEEAPG